jgi:butyrate kinase
MHRILVINLGSTSSKVAVFEDETLKCDATLRHEEEMKLKPTAANQCERRKELVLNWLAEKGYSMSDFDAIAARGATIFEAQKGGTYLVDGKYKELLLELYIPDKPLIHGNRIITPLCLSLVEGLNIPIYITDPSSVNEMIPIARLSGIKGFERRGRFHALNQKMAARKHALAIGKDYEDCRFVVAHMGGGISVGAHAMGKVIDVSDAGEGYGPFTPDRAGTVGTEVMLTLSFDRGLSRAEVFRIIRGGGGLSSHLGTADLKEAEAMAEALAKAEASSLCSLMAMMPRPPPPPSALSMMGRPKELAISLAKGTSTAPSEPGTTGMPKRWANRRTSTLLPNNFMDSALEPIKAMPASSQSFGNLASSEANPQPGWMATIPLRAARAIIFSISK